MKKSSSHHVVGWSDTTSASGAQRSRGVNRSTLSDNSVRLARPSQLNGSAAASRGGAALHMSDLTAPLKAAHRLATRSAASATPAAAAVLMPGQATFADLCQADKQRVARLIRELAAAGQCGSKQDEEKDLQPKDLQPIRPQWTLHRQSLALNPSGSFSHSFFCCRAAQFLTAGEEKEELTAALTAERARRQEAEHLTEARVLRLQQVGLRYIEEKKAKGAAWSRISNPSPFHL